MEEISRSAILIEEGEPLCRGQEAPAGDCLAAAGEMVLLVEDDPLVRRVAQAMLERLGFEVLTAGEGGEAIDMVRIHANHVALVISDLHLPGMNGREVVAAVQRMRPGIAAILTSGDAECTTAPLIGTDCPPRFLSKPFELAALKRAVERSLAEHRSKSASLEDSALRRGGLPKKIEVKTDDARKFIYVIDPEDTIVEVNPEWLAFAEENAYDRIKYNAVIGSKLWDHIQDAAVQHLYKIAFARARKGVCIEGLPYRCDAPDCRRFLEMSICGTAEGRVTITSRILRAECREPVSLLSDFRDMSDGVVAICSFCKRIRVGETQWAEVEDAMRLLGLNEAWPLPQLSHSVCGTCFAEWEATIEDD